MPSEAEARSADTMVRLAGVSMVFSGLITAVIAAMWVLSLIWVLIGLLWLIPLGIAMVEVVAGLCMIALGRHAWWGGGVAVVSGFAALCCFNVISPMLDLVAAVLSVMAGTLTTRSALT